VRLTPWDLGGLRFGVAFAVACVLWLLGHGRGLPWGRGVVLGLLAGCGFALPSYLGFTMAPAAHGALILSGTLPFLVALGAWLVLDERFGRARLASLALLLAGLGLFGTEAYVHQHAPPGAWRGDLLFLAASAAWAAYTILARRWGPTPMQSVVAVGLSCGLLYVPVFALALPSRLDAAPVAEIVLQALFQGVIAVPIALFLYTKALAILGSGRVTTITALVPGTAAVAAVPLLGEPLGLLSILGLALVCGAVIAGVSRQGLRMAALNPQ
jgi:drug/metabolite transporter (DMT)-like permease